MGFTVAAALWLLPLALLPLLARRRRPLRRVPVAAMQFWAAAAARDAATLPRRLRRHWLALVQAAIAAVIVVAIAQPWWTASGGTAALVVDTSLSMSAVDGGQSRLAVAARRAVEWAAQLPAGTQIRLVTTSPAPQQVGEYSSRGGGLERALAALRPTDAGGRIEAAVAFARAGNPTPGRVLVVTDTRAPRDRAGIEWAAVGARADNAAIVTLRAGRTRATAASAGVIAQVWNYGAHELSTTLTLERQGGEVVLRQPLTIAPRSGATAAAVVATPGLVTATLDSADAIAADNTRSTVIPAPLAVRVAFTGGGARSYLEAAVRSHQGVEIVAQPDRADVVVCAGCTAAAVPAAPADAGVLLVPPAAAAAAPAPLASIETRIGPRPPPGFDGIEAVAIDGPEPANGVVIARAGDRPAVVASESAGRRVVELRLDLARSALALTPAFPILVADAVDWLSNRELHDATFSAGEPAVQLAPSGGAGPATVIGPSGTQVAAVADGNRLTVAGTETAGVYLVRRGSTEVPFAVNPVTEGESDLDTTGEANFVLEPQGPRPAPGTLALTTLALGAALALLVVEWRMRPGPWRSRRAAAAALLAVAVAAPRVPWGDAPRAVVFALDVSNSMDARRGNALAFLQTATARMRRGDRAGLVVFGANAAAERPLDAAPIAGATPTARTEGGATNLEQGLRAARAALPADGSSWVVLVSDGRQTAGDAGAEALAARSAGVAIDVFAPRPGRAATSRPTVTGVAVPPTVAQGEAFEIRATVAGEPGAAAVVTFEGAGATQRRSITLPTGGTATVAVPARATQPGFAVYRASIDTSDALTDFAGEAAGAVVAVAGEPRLLYVSDAAPVLTTGGYRTERATPEQTPRTAAALAAFDVVVLDDVAPERLDDPQRRALAQHVAQGGGMFVLGSPRSLTPPGGPDPLDEILPLDLRPRRGQRAPGLALVVVFDKSGSMDDRIDGAPKIEFARQAVERVVASLPPTDAVGVIAFDSTAVDVAPLQPGHEAAALAARLNAVRPSGATAIAPALERAVGWLRAPAAAGFARRLVLLVSDGRTGAADQARARLALRAPGIEVSTVALGDEADRAFLGDLARAGNGRTFYPRRLGDLPALAAREAVRVSGGYVVNERFTVQALRHAVLNGLDRSSMPTLGGYVVGSLRPGAEAALRSPLGDPVLAVGRHGLGKVAVYAADLRSPWSAGLRAWRDGPALLAQTTRWVSRRVDHPFLHTGFAERNRQLRLRVEARDDDGFLNQLDVRAQVRVPSGAGADLVLVPTAPGVYETAVPLADAGPYLFSISATTPDGRLDARVQRGFFWTAAAERAGDVDAAGLAGIARVSGGRVLTAGDDPFGGARARDRRDMAPWLAGAALLLFLASVLSPSAARWRAAPRERLDISHREAA